MAVPRHRLIALRKSRGFTQESLALALGVERSTVGRWENGEREPGPRARPKLRTALAIDDATLIDLLADSDHGPVPTAASAAHWVPRPGAGPASRTHDSGPHRGGYPDDLDPVPARPDLAEIDDMHRRHALRLFSMVGAMLALPPLGEDLAELPELAGYARLNTSLWQVFTLASSKATVLPLVREQQDVLTASLAQPHGPATRRQLCTLTADLYQLAGEIHFDANAYTDAAHSYALAAQASKDAAAFDLWACALTRHAFISVYERKFADARPMLELAAALARRGDSGLSTRHWVAAVQAETFAGLGDLDACQRALDTADQVRELTGPVHNGGWLRFDGSRLAEERGTCYTTLGRPDLAEAALTDALHQDLSPRRRASVLTDLAVIGAQRRDPDQVLAYAQAVLDQARRTGSGVIGSKLRGLRPHLAPLLADARIDHLSSEITALAGSAAGR
ncbi:helix-turn-helix transcriptional regulator [Kutzneria viridogrisea]|uniref:DNA-binding XRE family transcriptional regulator/tetratricopeptide (TPR) repeat protein n=1 Tax=Kutzneria viridogrisea TaxID=47990 RepID=A0ABR6BCD3_9PSEU|nr:DNA-binding XRE family transcriptional regulator/tetratricopeptide (TPR) repeat protein [Kutzneria viridogrisea]